MIEGSGSGSRAGSGSIPLTSGSGSGSGRPKNMWIRIRFRIRNTEKKLKKCVMMPCVHRLNMEVDFQSLFGLHAVLGIRIRDPGLGAFLTPGSGIRDGRRGLLSRHHQNLSAHLILSRAGGESFIKGGHQNPREDTFRFVQRHFFLPRCPFTPSASGSGIRDPGWTTRIIFFRA